MNTLTCPACEEQCTTIPSGPDGTWFEGACGVCQCGAHLHVVVNAAAERASLELDSDDEPIRCIRLSPDLADGQHYSIVRADDAAAILAAVHEWVLNAETTGSEATLRVVYMTAEELEKLGTTGY